MSAFLCFAGVLAWHAWPVEVVYAEKAVPCQCGGNIEKSYVVETDSMKCVANIIPLLYLRQSRVHRGSLRTSMLISIASSTFRELTSHTETSKSILLRANAVIMPILPAPTTPMCLNLCIGSSSIMVVMLRKLV